jgi:hypothetical protein
MGSPLWCRGAEEAPEAQPAAGVCSIAPPCTIAMEACSSAHFWGRAQVTVSPRSAFVEQSLARTIAESDISNTGRVVPDRLSLSRNDDVIHAGE